MNATTKYTPAKIQEWLDARRELSQNPRWFETDEPRDRMDRAEAALMAEGWQNYESEAEMIAMLEAGK